MINKKEYGEFITIYNITKEIDCYYKRIDKKIENIQLLKLEYQTEKSIVLFSYINEKIKLLNKNNYNEFIGIIEGIKTTLNIYYVNNLI